MKASTMLATLRTLAGFAASFALAGALVATAAAPGFLTWHNAPGAGKAQCDCEEVTRMTARQVIVAQGGGLVAGGVVGIGVGIAWLRRSRRREAEKAAAATTAAAATATAALPEGTPPAPKA